MAQATGRSKAQGARDYRRDRKADGGRRSGGHLRGGPRVPRKGLGFPSRSKQACHTCLRRGMARASQTLPARRSRWPRELMQVALTAVMFASHANTDVAVAEVRRRAGTQLDPNLADLLIERADELLGDLDEMDAYQAVLAAEPSTGTPRGEGRPHRGGTNLREPR